MYVGGGGEKESVKGEAQSEAVGAVNLSLGENQSINEPSREIDMNLGGISPDHRIYLRHLMQ